MNLRVTDAIPCRGSRGDRHPAWSYPTLAAKDAARMGIRHDVRLSHAMSIAAAAGL